MTSPPAVDAPLTTFDAQAVAADIESVPAEGGPSERRQSRARATANATLGAIAGSALGAILPFAITAMTSNRSQSDAYFLAVGSAFFVATILSVALEAAVVPFAVEALQSGTRSFCRFVRKLTLQTAAMALGISIIAVVVMAAGVVPAVGLTPEATRNAIVYVAVLGVYPVLASVASIASGSLQALNVFGWPTWTIGFRSLVAIILGVTLNSRIGLAGVALGLCLGEGLRCFTLHRVLVGRASKRGTGGTSDVTFSGSGSPWPVIGPQVLSLAIVGLSPVVDRIVAAQLGVGAITLIELGEKLFYTPLVLVTAGVSMVSGSLWARWGLEGNFAQLRRDFWRLQRAFALTATAVASAAITCIHLLSGPLEHGLAIRDLGNFTHVFVAYAIGLPFAVSVTLSARLLVVNKRTRALPLVGAVALALNIALDIVGARYIGVAGIALSSTFVRLTSCLFLALLAASALREKRPLRPVAHNA